MALKKAWEVCPYLNPRENDGIEYVKQIQLEARTTDPSDDDLAEGRLYASSADHTIYAYLDGSMVDLGAGAGSGDITAVVAGAGLTGGATSGSATLQVVNTDNKITVSADSIDITADSLVNADINTAAAIAWSKMASSTDIHTDGTVTDLTISSETSGDVLYFDGTNWVALASTSLPAGTASIIAQSATIEAGTYDVSLATTTQTTGVTTLTIPDFANVNDTFAFVTLAQTLANKTLTTPTIADLTNATHDHSNAAGGGNLGAVTATSINKVAFTAPATGSTLTIAEGKTLTASASITIAGTDAKTLTLSDDTTIATNAITMAGGEVITFTAANALTFTTTGATDITLPTTGTLATLGGTETLVAKTLTTPSINGRKIAVSAKTGAYTATATDEVLTGDATGGAFTVTLPTAVGITGTVYTIIKIDAGGNAVTIDGAAAETINGAATVALSTQYDYRTIVSDGANWLVIGA